MIKTFLTMTAVLAFCLLLSACTESDPGAADVQPRPAPTTPLTPPSGPGGGLTPGGDAGGTGGQPRGSGTTGG